jgi:hypothetical protein
MVDCQILTQKWGKIRFFADPMERVTAMVINIADLFLKDFEMNRVQEGMGSWH